METDAPTDNRGKGERFSPTDTLCISLATCMITTMGIRAADMKIDLTGTNINITKQMLNDPRRIGKIEIVLQMPDSLGLEEKDRTVFEKIGDNCPVMKSLHPDLNVVTEYKW
jgi:uncharacterized OsmC-like protein